jgi:hypothetical protein
MSGSDFINSSTIGNTSISADINNVQNPYQVPVMDYSTPVERSPGGFYYPANTPAQNIPAMDLETKIAGQQAMLKQQNPNQFNTLMYAGQLLNSSQQRPRQAMGQIRPAQQINLNDPISALLAPKRKRERALNSLL